MYIRVSARLGRHLRKIFAAKNLLDLRSFTFVNVISQSIKKMASAPEHACALCVAPSDERVRSCTVDPSEWSYYAILICAVAAAWRLENPPKAIHSMTRLTALAARVVSEKCKFFLSL